MRQAAGGALLFVLLVACGGDDSANGGAPGADDHDQPTPVATPAAVGETEMLSDGIFVTVEGFSVEWLDHEHEQVNPTPSQLDIPVIVATVRAENRRSSDDRSVSDYNPEMRTYCADRTGPGAVGEPIHGPNTAVIPGPPEWPGSSLPMGDSSRAEIAVLVPGQQQIGAPLPDTVCDEPVVRFEPTVWSGADRGRPGVEVRIPLATVNEFVTAQAEYQASLDARASDEPLHPGDVTVRVIDATGDPEAGAVVMDRIADRGYRTVDPLEGPETPLVIMYFAAGYQADAHALWDAVGHDLTPFVEYEVMVDEDAVGADGRFPTDGAEIVLVLGSGIIDE